MRLIDKLAQLTDAAAIEYALDAAASEQAGDARDRERMFDASGVFSQLLAAEIPVAHKVAVRLVTNTGGVSGTVYTYLAEGEKPHPGSMVLVPNARGGSGQRWGIVQTDAALSGGDMLPQRELKKIIRWVHRYEAS